MAATLQAALDRPIQGGCSEKLEYLRHRVREAVTSLGVEPSPLLNPDVSEDEIDEDPGADATYTVDVSTHPDVVGLLASLRDMSKNLREAAESAEDAASLFALLVDAADTLDKIANPATTEPQQG